MRHDGPAHKSGLRSDVAVVVATVPALQYHGGVAVPDLASEDLAAVESGMRNLSRHLHNRREVYGIPCVVAVNRFPTDTDAERARVVGAQALARGVLEVIEEPSPYSFSTDAQPRGAPVGHSLHVREVRLAAGAGFVALVRGDVMTMPGLPRVPASTHIDLTDDGVIVGLS